MSTVNKRFRDLDTVLERTDPDPMWAAPVSARRTATGLAQPRECMSTDDTLYVNLTHSFGAFCCVQDKIGDKQNSRNSQKMKIPPLRLERWCDAASHVRLARLWRRAWASQTSASILWTCLSYLSRVRALSASAALDARSRDGAMRRVTCDPQGTDAVDVPELPRHCPPNRK